MGDFINYGVAPTWQEHEFERQILRKIYDGADGLGMFELKTPDQVTTFLVCHGAIDFEKGIAIQYGIETSRNCPKRKAFEFGKLSWTDFWFHRDWLLQIDMPMKGGLVPSRFIDPEEICPSKIARFRDLGLMGPYQLKRKHLEDRMKIARIKGEDGILQERNYLDFMARYGHLI